MNARRIAFGVAAYAAMALIACVVGVWRDGSIPWHVAPSSSFFAERTGLHRELAAGALGLVLAAVTIASTRLLMLRAQWARDLRAAMRPMLDGATDRDLALLALSSGVSEEMLFRGALQPSVGLIVASLAFGLMHVGPTRAFRAWTVWAIGMGFVLGALFEATGTLTGPVVAHVGINAINLRSIAHHDARFDAGDGKPQPPKLVARVKRDA